MSKKILALAICVAALAGCNETTGNESKTSETP
jgi:predicted small secreted protein